MYIYIYVCIYLYIYIIYLYNDYILYPPTPWSLEAKGKARGEAVHGRDTNVRHELSPEVQANRGSGASVSQRFEGRVRHTVVFRRFGRAAEGAVKVSV